MIYGLQLTNPTKDKLFYTSPADYPIGTKVVIETAFGCEIAIVLNARVAKQSQDEKGLPVIYRAANEADLELYYRNMEDAEHALKLCRQAIDNFRLDMHLLASYYSLTRSRLLFVYVADERVDFRALLRELSSIFRTRIELRQVGSRDRAKMIGGVAACGMSLCCNTFIDNFDGISISMAKNQMLTLNIQKLSGHCSKLLCCLKYEDPIYSEMRESLPRLGVKVHYNGKEYRLSSYNILSETARLDNHEEVVTIDFATLRSIAL